MRAAVAIPWLSRRPAELARPVIDTSVPAFRLLRDLNPRAPREDGEGFPGIGRKD